MSQVDQLKSIDKLVKKTKTTSPALQKLIGDWNAWYPHLSFYERNMANDIITQALAFRSALADLVTGTSTTTFGASPYSKPGAPVPTPKGYRRAIAKEITPKVQGFAAASLSKLSVISKKSGQAATIGKQYSGVVDGKQWLAQSEWHFDNHPDPKRAPYYHFGVSIFTPIAPTEPPTDSPHYTATLFRTEIPGTEDFSKANPYA
jgi:hypothetical protein